MAAEIDDAVEMRQFVRTHGVDRLEAQPEKWVRGQTSGVRAEANNITRLGEEIASMTAAQGRKRHEREMAGSLKSRGGRRRIAEQVYQEESSGNSRKGMRE